MAQQILGLDIGSHSIKAALFDVSFRSFALTDLFQSPPLRLHDVDPVDQPVIITEALIKLFEKNRLKNVECVTAMPGRFVSNRIIDLPKMKKRDLDMALLGQLEDFIPFELDDMVVDRQMVRQGSDGITSQLAVAVQKDMLQRHLDVMSRVKMDPSFVTVDAMALFNLNALVPDTVKTYAIIDMGHTDCNISIVHNGKLEFIRTLYTAGKDIDESIRSKLNFTLDQSIEVKEGHGILELDTQAIKSKDLKRLSDAIKKVIDPLYREILQSFHMYKSQSKETRGRKIQRVFFCGGTSLIKNVPEYFSYLVNIPAQRLYLLEHRSAKRKSRPKEPLFAPAMAIGLKAASRGKAAGHIDTINFRKGEFSFAKDMSGLGSHFLFVTRWAAVLFIAGLVYLLTQRVSLKSMSASYEKRAISAYTRLLPDLPKPKSSKKAVKSLKANIGVLTDKQGVVSAGLNGTTALDLLLEVSNAISPSISLDTRQLSIQSDKISLKGETDSIKSVDDIVDALESLERFERIDKSDISNSSSNPGQKKFALTMFLSSSDEG